MTNFPKILYRAFSSKKYVREFINKGRFRLGLIDQYVKIEDEKRVDQTEGQSLFLLDLGTALKVVLLSGTLTVILWRKLNQRYIAHIYNLPLLLLITAALSFSPIKNWLD